MPGSVEAPKYKYKYFIYLFVCLFIYNDLGILYLFYKRENWDSVRFTKSCFKAKQLVMKTFWCQSSCYFNNFLPSLSWSSFPLPIFGRMRFPQLHSFLFFSKPAIISLPNSEFSASCLITCSVESRNTIVPSTFCIVNHYGSPVGIVHHSASVSWTWESIH